MKKKESKLKLVVNKPAEFGGLTAEELHVDPSRIAELLELAEDLNDIVIEYQNLPIEERILVDRLRQDLKVTEWVEDYKKSVKNKIKIDGKIIKGIFKEDK
jgi:hypothetical protein